MLVTQPVDLPTRKVTSANISVHTCRIVFTKLNSFICFIVFRDKISAINGIAIIKHLYAYVSTPTELFLLTVCKKSTKNVIK